MFADGKIWFKFTNNNYKLLTTISAAASNRLLKPHAAHRATQK